MPCPTQIKINAINTMVEAGETFAAHKALIVLVDSAEPRKASFIAWGEGPEGYDRRLKAFRDAGN